MCDDRPQMTTVPAPAETYVFIKYAATWSGDWPETKDDIDMVLHPYPVLGFLIRDEDRPYAVPIYLADGGQPMIAEPYPLMLGEDGVDVGVFHVDVLDKTNDVAREQTLGLARDKCWRRVKELQRQESKS